MIFSKGLHRVLHYQGQAKLEHAQMARWPRCFSLLFFPSSRIISSNTLSVYSSHSEDLLLMGVRNSKFRALVKKKCFSLSSSQLYTNFIQRKRIRLISHQNSYMLLQKFISLLLNCFQFLHFSQVSLSVSFMGVVLLLAGHFLPYHKIAKKSLPLHFTCH